MYADQSTLTSETVCSHFKTLYFTSPESSHKCTEITFYLSLVLGTQQEIDQWRKMKELIHFDLKMVRAGLYWYERLASPNPAVLY